MTDKRKIKQQKSNRRKTSTEKSSVRDEFRKGRGRAGGHPNYIFRKVGNNYEFIGVTHSEITRGVKNIKLDKNFNPTDDSPAFLQPIAEKRSTEAFHNKTLQGWKLGDSDRPKVEAIKKKAKKKKSDNN